MSGATIRPCLRARRGPWTASSARRRRGPLPDGRRARREESRRTTAGPKQRARTRRETRPTRPTRAAPPGTARAATSSLVVRGAVPAPGGSVSSFPFQSVRAVVEIEIRRARRVEINSTLPPRFLKPLYDPGRSDFPSPVLASVLHAISQGGPSPSARNCGAGAPYAPPRWSLPRPFATMQAPRSPALCLVRTRLLWPPSAQSPFARSGCYPRRGGLKAAWRGVTPSSSLVRALCARPSPSPCLR